MRRMHYEPLSVIPTFQYLAAWKSAGRSWRRFVRFPVLVAQMYYLFLASYCCILRNGRWFASSCAKYLWFWVSPPWNRMCNHFCISFASLKYWGMMTTGSCGIKFCLSAFLRWGSSQSWWKKLPLQRIPFIQIFVGGAEKYILGVFLYFLVQNWRKKLVSQRGVFFLKVALVGSSPFFILVRKIGWKKKYVLASGWQKLVAFWREQRFQQYFCYFRDKCAKSA